MNKLYMMCGIPGSGKSTYAKENFKDAVYISRDEIRYSLLKDENDFYFSKETEVYNTFVKQISNALQRNQDVVADATHLNSGSRSKLLKRIDADNYEVILVYMKVPIELALERNKTRTGRALVPERVVMRMQESLVLPNSLHNEGIKTLQIVNSKGELIREISLERKM